MERAVVVSVPVHDGAVTMRSLRDLVEACDEAPEDGVVLVLSDELRWEQ